MAPPGASHAVPPPVPPGRRSWWGRNWLWVIPTGCLTIIVLGLAVLATIIMTVFGMLRTTDVYKTALKRAKQDQRVIVAIGEPIKEGWYVGGSAEVSGGSGKSDLTIPIHGPNGKATIYLVATKFAGDWQYSKLMVKIADSGEMIDLNEQGDRPEQE